MYTTKYGFGIKVEGDFEEVLARTEEALKSQGFGVLSDIDVKATLKKKLDVDMPRYRILGACNPPLAHRALTEEPELGLLLPCNVIVYEHTDGTCSVAAVDPVKNLGIVGNPDLEPIAKEVKEKMTAVVESLATAKSGS
jgi:uncharacterized protein (DUF302 family)